MANKKVSQLTSKPSVLTTDLFPIADPSTGQLYKTTISDLGTAIGSGVSSVNSLVGAVVLDTDDIQELVSPTNKWFTDTRARAALSASSPLTYNSGTGVFGIQVANGSQNGYLSSTDWTTFNAKQAALSGTGFVKISGTTISYDNSTYLTTSAAASTYLALGGGTMTGALIGTSAGFTGYVGIGNTSPLYQLDVTGSGRFEGDLHILSSNPRIYLTDSDNNPDYFISNTDGTFTIYDVTNSASRLTISTSQIQPRLPIVSNSSIQGTAFYSDSFFSATTFVQATTFMASPSYRLTGGTSPTGLYFGHTDKVVLANYTVGGGIDFETNGGNITMQLSSGGVLSTTGGASFSGALSGTSATFSGDITIGTIGNSSSGYHRGSFNGTNTSANLSSVYFSGGDGSQNRAGLKVYQTWGGTYTDTCVDLFVTKGGVGGTTALSINGLGAATFSSSVTAGGSIASGVGLSVANGTNARKFELGYSTGAGYNFFQVYDGTSFQPMMINNTMYFNSSGNVGIGTTVPVSIGGYTALTLNNATTGGILTFQQNGTNKASIYNDGSSNLYLGVNSGATIFENNGSERMRITSSGLVAIGTTSALINESALAVTSGGNTATFKTTLNGGNGLLVWNSITNGNPGFISFGTEGSYTERGYIYYDRTAGQVKLSATSDARLKKDIIDAPSVLPLLEKIKVRQYKWKENNNENIGFIAQELYEVIERAVSVGEDLSDGSIKRAWGVDNGTLVPYLVKAIQEIYAELKALKA